MSKLKHTQRGFGYMEFEDLYGDQFSIQKSSLATDDAIWFGIDDANPQIMCRDAVRLGLRHTYGDERDNGWTKYGLPDEVHLTTRMHLNRDQVRELIPILQRFCDTGELSEEDDD